MEELKDYSGPLKPDLRFEDLSKETLIDLLHAYAKLYILMYNEFTNLIRERHGSDEAWVSQLEAWMRVGPVANRTVCQAMNIEPGGVESLLKELQLDPGYPPNFDKAFAGTSKMELRDKNHGTFTLERCYALEIFEMAGREMVIKFCHGMEPPTFTGHSRAHNPNMKCRPLKMPPRQSTDETPACAWEYYLEE